MFLKEKPIKNNMKSWLLTIPILSIMVFILSAIISFLIINPFHYLSYNAIIYFSSIILPSFIITLLFNREINRWKSTLFGGFIGFIGGQIWLLYWVITTSINNSTYADYSLLPIIWLPFSFLFIGSGICGALLSYFIRIYYKKNSKKTIIN
jgi:hypothetical protein